MDIAHPVVLGLQELMSLPPAEYPDNSDSDGIWLVWVPAVEYAPSVLAGHFTHTAMTTIYRAHIQQGKGDLYLAQVKGTQLVITYSSINKCYYHLSNVHVDGYDI